MLNQKEAVFQAVVGVTGFAGEGTCEPTREQKAMIHQVLVEGFRSGKIKIDTQYPDEKLKQYVVGLLNNWLRKDTRLNGGSAYVPKNPGSRQGSGDAQLKALRALMSATAGDAERAEIQRYIDARTAEIAAAKQPVIDFSALPESLRAKFTKS